MTPAWAHASAGARLKSPGSPGSPGSPAGVRVSVGLSAWMRLVGLLLISLVFTAPRGSAGEAETGGGRDKDAARDGGSMRCSPPFEMPAESLGLRLRICPKDRVELVGGTDTGLDMPEVPDILVGRFNAASSTENTHFFNVGGDPCGSTGGVHRPRNFYMLLDAGEQADVARPHQLAVAMGPCFYVLEICTLSACSDAARAAHAAAEPLTSN